MLWSQCLPADWGLWTSTNTARPPWRWFVQTSLFYIRGSEKLAPFTWYIAGLHLSMHQETVLNDNCFSLFSGSPANTP